MKRALNVLALIHTEWNKKPFTNTYLINLGCVLSWGETAIVHQLIFTCRLCPQEVHQLLIIASLLER